MLNKKLANIFLFFILNINLFAHKIPSVDISLTYLENDFFKILSKSTFFISSIIFLLAHPSP